MSTELRNYVASQEISRNVLRDGFDELERYLSSSFPQIPLERESEITPAPPNVTGDPVRDGLDLLDRTLKAAQLHAKTQRRRDTSPGTENV
jgi:hypothetical protein